MSHDSKQLQQTYFKINYLLLLNLNLNFLPKNKQDKIKMQLCRYTDILLRLNFKCVLHYCQPISY